MDLVEAFQMGEGYIWAAAKVASVFAFLIYLVFALVVIKQVNKMTETLAVGFENELKVIAILHFLFALGTFLVALIIL